MPAPKGKSPVVCDRPECEVTDTKVFRIRLPGRSQERRVQLCKDHGRVLEVMAEWSDDTPVHERRPERRRQATVHQGRFTTEQQRLASLPLLDE